MKRRVKIELAVGQCSHCRRRNEMRRTTYTFCGGRQEIEWQCLNCGAHAPKPTKV